MSSGAGIIFAWGSTSQLRLQPRKLATEDTERTEGSDHREDLLGALGVLCGQSFSGVLGEEALDDLAVDVRQAVVAALEAVGQLLVVHAEQVEDRRLQVVDVDLVLAHGEAELVALAVAEARLDAAARHEHGVAVGVVIAAED